MLRIRLCGGVDVEADGRLLPPALLAGRQGRLVLAYLACERHRAVPREELAELLWPGELPASWTSSLHAVISRLRKLVVEAGLDGTSTLTSAGGAYRLVLPEDAEVDFEVATAAVAQAEQAVAAGDGPTAVDAGSRAAAIAGRGFLNDDGEWLDEQRDAAHDLAVRAALAVADGHLLQGAPGRAVEAAREALGRDPLREAAFRVLMRALAAAGERAEALRVWERCRTTLVEELGVDPSPETEAVYLEVLEARDRPEPAPPVPAGPTALPSGVVTFLLTDIVGSTVLWEHHPAAMATALERHDALVAEVVAAHGGTLLKSKLEGDATVSVFARATAGALAALALREALRDEPWPEDASPSLRMAMHTGEAFERDGDYFGPALNRAARLRGLAGAGQVLLSQAVAELVRDHLPEGVALADRGHRDLRGLSRGENVYELAPEEELGSEAVAPTALERPPLPAPLANTGPFVGRDDELARLSVAWEQTTHGEPQALLVAGEPGVGKSRLVAECARAAHDAGAIVVYGRCDEELGAPLQPFIEALRTLTPALGSARLRAVRGIDELSRLVPELGELLPDAAPAARADPDSERYALFDATTELLCAASVEAPTLVVLDDLHWAGKTTLSLLRHLLRNAKDARLLVLGTYRDTELARTHPLAALLADLRRDRSADKLTLSGLEPDDVAAYLRAVGNPDRALGRELAEVTSGNPFFLIEALRHVEETGGRWEPGSLPEGVREATGRRLSQLSDSANDALSVAAVAGTTFDLALVERVSDVDVLDALGEAVQAGLVVEEPAAPGRFRFAHALVRQVLLAELVTIKRLRLHRTIAELLEAEPGPDPDEHLTDLAHHWFECALTGGGEKAVDACRRAADRARERLAYEEAGDLYGMAIQALDAVEQVDDDDVAALHLARCDALLTAGDVAAARGAIDALGQAARGSDRLTAWHITYAGQLAVLAEPDRLDEIVASIGDAAAAMHEAGDLTGEATARYVHALALERLGRIGAAQRALDDALAAARTADDRRLADAILAEVPPAALWGPSPVTRASGNCLDVVRVLRITDGAPAVESVALRCQAVLEALRGRMDAARRMVASAHRIVDQLGLVHRRLETDVSAGFIELLDAQAEAAEGHLRPAYEELRDRGLGGEAAQAAALLGRALLMQGRDDEAEAVAQEAERLAGADLKAAIAWRDVRAEAAARRGDTALALDLAREAVDLATATDALLLVADARLALATVLRATGDVAGARAEATRAIEVCDAKGATALAEGARARAGSAERALAERIPAAATDPTQPDNAAVRLMRRCEVAWNQRDWPAVAALLGDRWDSSDRRPTFASEWSVDQSLQSIKDIFDAGSVPTVRPIAARGERLALFDWTWASPPTASPAYEVRFLTLFEMDESLAPRHSTYFELDDLDMAMAELDRLHLATEFPFSNSAVREVMRMGEALNRHDVDAALAVLAPDPQVDDRRALVGGMVSEDETLLTNLAVVLERRGSVRSELLATRGDDLCLTRSWWRSDQGEVELLHLGQLDDQGRYAVAIWFDADDLDPAYSELDRRYLEGGGAEHAAIVGTLGGVFEAMNTGDWAAARRVLRDDLRVRDHRRTHAPLSERGADEWAASWADTASVWTASEVRIAHLPRLSATAGVCVLRLTSAGAEAGGPSERLWIQVFAHDGSSITGVDVYELDQLADALARFDELAHPPEHFFDNLAVRAIRGSDAAISRGDYDAALALFAPSVDLDDRRPLVGFASEEWSALEVTVRYLIDGRGTIRTEILATRGDHLCIAHSKYDSAHAEVELLQVIRADDQACHEHVVWLDPQDLDAAYDELDRLWRDGGAPDAAGFLTQVIANDWEAAAALLAPDCVIDDHRPARFGRIEGRDQIIAFYRSTVEVAPGIRGRVHHAKSDGRITIGQVSMAGDADGVEYETGAISVNQRNPRGQITHFDFYDPTDLALAVTRYRELVAQQDGTADDGCHERFVNTAVEAVRLLNTAINAQDVEQAVSTFAPGYQLADRRSLVGGTFTDEDANRRAVRYIMDGRGRVTTEVLATRGDRLCLDRSVWEGPQGEVVLLHLARADDARRLEAGVWFDADDVDAAYADLDRQYLELGPDPLFLTAKVASDATNAQDWDALEAVITPDSVFVDHRPIRFGVIEGSAAFIDFYRSTLDLTPDARQLVHHHVEQGRVGLRVMSLVGTIDGAPFQNPGVTVYQAGRDGRLTRREFFGEEQFEAAFARFDELVAQQAQLDDDGCHPRFVNDAVRTGRTLVDAMNAWDVDAGVGAFSPAGTFQDQRALRRATVGADSEGFRDMLGYFCAAKGTVGNEVLATRGERLSLGWTSWTAEGAQADVLWIAQAGDDDLLDDITWLDSDDHELAYEELDRRYLDLGADPRFLAEHREKEAIDARDWDALEAQLAPDGVAVDHRPARFGVIRGSRGYVELQRSGAELSPDVSFVIHHHISEGPVALEVVSRVGTVDGGTFHNRMVDVIRRDASGRVTQRDFYGDDQLEEALALYDQLVAEHARVAGDGCHPRFVNAAVRGGRALCRAMNDRDVEASISAFTPAGTFQDRRALRRSMVDAASTESREALGFLFDARGTLETQVVATRGEGLSLSRTIWANEDAEVPLLWIAEADDRDLLEDVTWFDVHDLDAAYRELDARWAASHDGEVGPRAGDIAAAVKAYDEGDLGPVMEFYGPNLRVVDHRPVSFGELDRETWVAHIQRLKADAPDARFRIHHLLETPTALLRANTISGTAPSGEFELATVHVDRLAPDGRYDRIDIYGADELEAAFVRFDELSAPATLAVSNLATENSKRFLAALASGDSAAIEATLHPTDYRYTDRRRHAQLEEITERAWLFNKDLDPAWGDVARAPWVGDPELLATRGERLALFRGRNPADSDIPLDFLAVVEVDDLGRRTAVVQFDLDDLDAAYDELDARYGDADRWPLSVRTVNARDWERLASMFDERVAIRDHRRVGWGPLDVDGLIDRYRMTGELAPDARYRLHHTLEAAGDVVLFTVTGEGTHDGAAFALPSLCLGAWPPNGGIEVLELYDVEDLDRARVRVAELVSARTTLPFTNLAVRNTQRLVEAGESRDWDGVLALVADSFRMDDRRGVMQMDGFTAEQTLRPLFDLAESHWPTWTVLATRGEHLALIDTTFRFSDGAAGVAQNDFVYVLEVDEDGLRTAAITFDPDDLDDAYEELDARFAGSGPMFDGLRAYNDRDWAHLTTNFDPSALIHDHRRVGWGRLDVDGVVERYRVTTELSPDARGRVYHLIESSDRAGLASMGVEGTHEGGLFERPFLAVAAWDAAGRFTVWEMFEPEDLDAARARYGELDAASGTLELTNAAVRSGNRVAELFHARETEAVLALFADGNVYDDRRRNALMQGITAEQSLEVVFQTSDSEWRVPTVIATRGERLALWSTSIRFTAGSAGPAETEMLVVTEVDEAGLRTATVTFDTDDLLLAYDELDARYVAQGGRDCAAWRHTLASGDWEAVRDFVDPGFVLVDRRTYGLGRLDRDHYLQSIRELYELSPDAGSVLQHLLAASGPVTLGLTSVVGTHQGGDFDSSRAMVERLTRDGRVLSWEVFDLDQIDQAWARYHELTSGPAADPHANAALTNQLRLIEVWETRDWDALMALFAPDYAGSERRGTWVVDDISAERGFRPFYDLDECVFRVEALVATRGDRLALLSGSIRFSDGAAGESTVAFLYVAEVDDHGLCTATVIFDEGDLDAAYDELDARYVAQGGYDVGAIGRAQRDRDWDGLAAQFTSDYQLVDHRVLGLLSDGVEGLIRDNVAVTAMVPDNRIQVLHVLAASPLAVHSICRGIGTVDGGGDYETPLGFTGGITADGRWWVWHLYGPEQLDEARAQYEELADPTLVHPNRAARTVSAMRDAFARDDWEAMEALCAEDILLDDHRFHMTGDRQVFLESARTWAEQGSTLRGDLLAAPGERVCLIRRTAAGPDGDWEVEHFVVAEVDDDGLLTAYVMFAADDRLGAAKELDRRHYEELGAPAEVPAFDDAMNDHDLDLVGAVLRGRCRFEDRRRGRAGRVEDVEGYLASLEAALEITVGLHHELIRTHAVRPDGAVALARNVGFDLHGGSWEDLFIGVICWDDDGLSDLELYEPEDLEAALARFEELRPT